MGKLNNTSPKGKEIFMPITIDKFIDDKYYIITLVESGMIIKMSKSVNTDKTINNWCASMGLDDSQILWIEH